MPSDAKQRIENYPNLVQRLQHRAKRGAEKNIAAYFKFDLMGSAEFEWGSIPKAKKILASFLLGAPFEPVKITEGQNTAWYVGPPHVLEMAKTWFREELASDFTGMQERSDLREAYTAPTDRSPNGWFCVDGGYYEGRKGKEVWGIFTKKDFAKDFIRASSGHSS